MSSAKTRHRPLNSKQLQKATNETFRTPVAYWEQLFESFPFLAKGSILDPSAGDGRMHMCLPKNSRHMIIDIKKRERINWKKHRLHKKVPLERQIIGNFLEIKPRKHKFNAVISNPPFSIARDFVDHGLKFVDTGGYIVMLHRIGWIGTIDRSYWLNESCLKYMIVITKRPVWEIDGRDNNRADNIDYAFYVFKKGYNRGARIKWLFFDD